MRGGGLLTGHILLTPFGAKFFLSKNVLFNKFGTVLKIIVLLI